MFAKRSGLLSALMRGAAVEQSMTFAFMFLCGAIIFAIDVLTPSAFSFRPMFMLPVIFSAYLLRPLYSVLTALAMTLLNLAALQINLVEVQEFSMSAAFMPTFLLYFSVAQLSFLRKLLD